MPLRKGARGGSGVEATPHQQLSETLVYWEGIPDCLEGSGVPKELSWIFNAYAGNLNSLKRVSHIRTLSASCCHVII